MPQPGMASLSSRPLCSHCGGLGWTNSAVVACLNCGGTGRVPEPAQPSPARIGTERRQAGRDMKISEHACVLAWSGD